LALLSIPKKLEKGNFVHVVSIFCKVVILQFFDWGKGPAEISTLLALWSVC